MRMTLAFWCHGFLLPSLYSPVQGASIGDWAGCLSRYIVIAYVIYLFGNGLASWAVSANPFFSSESRLQMDRDQKVTRRGPYHFVRDPAYLAAILPWPVTGLSARIFFFS